MKTQRRNFGGTMECTTQISPHTAYQSLAIDAVLLALNEQLPNLGDEEYERLVTAAELAAHTVLALAQVPDEWLDFLTKVNYDRSVKVRSQLWDIVFDLLPASEKGLGEQKVRAGDKIRACARPGREEAMRQAVIALEDAYMGEVLESIYAAFTIGYEVAHDPTRLLLEKARGS